MRTLVFLLALTCAGQTPDCNSNSNRREHAYTIVLTNGRTVEACGYSAGWEYPDCLILNDQFGNATTRLCHVASFEFGVPTPAPPAESPHQ